MDIRIIGLTDQMICMAASRDYVFRINEFFVIEDRNNGTDLLAEVVETHTYNPQLPEQYSNEVIDTAWLKSMKTAGYDVLEESVNIAKLKLIKEAAYPIETGSLCRLPEFDEIKDYFITQKPEKGLILGEIRNTESIYAQMPENYDAFRDIFDVYENNCLRAQNSVPYVLDYYAQFHYPHIGLFGGSGSGKSYALRVILEELMRLNWATVVIDPHYEMNFEKMTQGRFASDDGGKATILTLGREIGIDFRNLSLHQIKNLLSAVQELSEGMSSAVDALYRSKMSAAQFSDVIQLGLLGYKKESEWEGYGFSENEILKSRREISSKVPESSLQGVQWRFNRLDFMGLFNEDAHAVFDSLKQSKLVVIRGAQEILDYFSTYIIGALYNERRRYRDSVIQKKEKQEYFPPFAVVIDEAHNFCPSGFEKPSLSIMKEIAQEGRKYGVYMVLASQRPALIHPTIIAQLNTKLIFRTTRGQDIELIAQETDLMTEDTKRLPYLQTGDGFISESAMGRTMAVRVRMAKTRSPHQENPFDERIRFHAQEDDEMQKALIPLLPISSLSFDAHAQEGSKRLGRSISVDDMVKILNRWVEQDRIQMVNTPFGVRYEVQK